MNEHPAVDIHFRVSSSDLYRLTNLLQALLDDYQPAAIDTQSAIEWRVFFGSVVARDSARAAITASLAPEGIAATTVDVPDEDWARRSQADLKTVYVGNVAVAPPWDVPHDEDSGPSHPIVIVIQPSTGFGTGHHASTRLCLFALQQLDLHGRSVLDVGTGSGVLAIAASRLGADSVVAMDSDIYAVRAALENVALNGLTGRIDIRLGDFRGMNDLRTDVVAANLTGAMLTRYAADIMRMTTPGSCLVLGGLMNNEEPAVLQAFAPLAATWRATEDEWVGLVLRLTSAPA